MAAKPEDENHDYDFDGDNDDNSDDDGDDHDDDNDHDDNDDDDDDLVWKFHAWASLQQAGHSSDDCALLPQRFRCSTEESFENFGAEIE